MPNPWVSLRHDQLIPVNKVVNKKEHLEKGLRRRKNSVLRVRGCQLVTFHLVKPNPNSDLSPIYLVMFASPQSPSPNFEAWAQSEPTKIRPDPPLCNTHNSQNVSVSEWTERNQIGRIFTYCVIVNFVQFFVNYKSREHLWDYFYHREVM
jgi:hypothetical protein